MNTCVSKLAAILCLTLPVLAQSTWNGGGATANWTDNANWDSAPANGANLVFLTGSASGTTLNNNALSSVGSLTFNTSLPGGGITLGGNALAITGGIANNNTTAGRNVTIDNDLAIGAAQTWTALNNNGITTISGDLSNSGGPFNLTLSSNDTRSTLPSLRLSGSNSAYTGNINAWGSNTSGLMLMNPSAMIGGNIDLGNNDRSLWLQSGTGTYTFGLGGNPGAVSFRNGGQGGLRLFDGSITLDPGNGSDYSLGATANARIRLARQLNSNGNTPFQLTLGNSASYLILGSQNFAVGMAEAGGNLNDPRHTPVVRMDFALSDAGTARNLLVGDGGNSYTYVLRLTRDAGGVGANLGGSTITSNGGWVSVDGMNRLFDGGLDLGSGGIVLDGVSWSAFAADRSGGFTTGTPGAAQWRLNGGGFAARGSTVVIDATGTTTSTFDRNFQLGTAVMDTDGTYYANATVEIARDTTLSAARNVTIGGNGKGLAGSFGTFQEISGNLSGAGALSVAGEAFALQNNNWTGELVLSGANSWTGGLSYQDSGRFINLGAGGLQVQRAYVRFDGQGSLPTGNGGNPALLAVLDRNNGARGGFLLTGHGTETAYNLPAGYRFLFGGVNSGDNQGVFGSDGGLAKLEDSTILIHFSSSSSTSQTLTFLTREGSVLTLGGTAGAARLVPSTGQDLASAPTTATTVTDATTGSRTLVKRGEGTLVLEDVSYTDVAESGNTASQFVWQIGRASGGNSGSGAYFDGAVRETGTGTSDSLSGFNVQLAGGVLETSGLFNRSTGTGTTQVQWNNAGGGGFSAHGGALTVNLGGASASQTWGSSPFVRNNESLIFGSYTANDVVTFQNAINLNGAVREVRVIDNSASGTDEAEISGNLTGTGSSGLSKTGTGTLVLSGSNSYAGATLVNARHPAGQRHPDRHRRHHRGVHRHPRRFRPLGRRHPRRRPGQPRQQPRHPRRRLCHRFGRDRLLL
jgi:autotransporter-associated beta strand protein